MTPRATLSRSHTDQGVVWSVNLKTAQIVLGVLLMCTTAVGTLYAGVKAIVLPLVREEIIRVAQEKQDWGRAEHAAIRAETKERLGEVAKLEQDRYAEIIRRLEYLQARLDRLTER